MEHLNSQEGHPFIRAVAQYIRQHEKALANSLQLHVQRRRASTSQMTTSPTTPTTPVPASHSSTSTLAAALSFAGLSFKSHSVKSAQLTLTPHHLFYLLSRIEELDVDVGPMNVRIESVFHTDPSTSNYISFLQAPKALKSRGDADSIHSVSSVRSVMSGMSAFWSGMGVSSSSKSEKARIALENDMKYIYGAFTKLPSLRLTPDHRTPLIKGYEQFPFDTAVPLFAFKNLQQLEIIGLDFRSLYGWDRLADQLCLLTVKRGHLDDPLDLLENVVLDDAEKRRRRSNRSHGNAPSTPSWSVPSTPRADYAHSHSDPGSPRQVSPGTSPGAMTQDARILTTPVKSRERSQTAIESTSPKRPTPRRPNTSYRHVRTYSSKAKRSGSGSSNNSDTATTPLRDDAAINASWNVLPASKWQRLVYLSLADNGLTSLSSRSLQAVAPTLRSFNLSSNLFTEIPESLARLSRLVSLDLSNCMLESLHTLADHPLQSLVTLKIKSNRLTSLTGIENLPSLENLNIQDNKITDPDEAARLTSISTFRKLWIKHNPLTRSFADYRVRIMNHFRRVPGLTEDIVIDDQQATYSERKQLLDRPTTVESAALSFTPPAQPKVVLLQEPVKQPPPVIDTSNNLGVVTSLQREASNASARRKKGSRRRIVDLAAKDSSITTRDPTLDNGQAAISRPAVKVLTQVPSASESKQSLPQPSAPPIDVFDEDDMARTLTQDSLSDDTYRRNVEDLRSRYGRNWLNALGEESSQWHSDSSVPTLSSAHPPQLLHYHSTPPVVDVGSRAP